MNLFKRKNKPLNLGSSNIEDMKQEETTIEDMKQEETIVKCWVVSIFFKSGVIISFCNVPEKQAIKLNNWITKGTLKTFIFHYNTGYRALVRDGVESINFELEN